MTYDVFRLGQGAHAGNVDDLGQIDADSLDAAERMAALMFDRGDDWVLEVTEAVPAGGTGT